MEEGEEELNLLPVDGYPQNHLPILIRHSDTHVFINPDDFTGKNGTKLVNQDIDAIPTSAPCHPSHVLEKYTVKECGDYVLIDYINFMNEVTNTCVEICGNGIDDDFDGLTDENICSPDGNGFAPPPPVEICDNGIDDDLDGFIDCKDNDCCSIGNVCGDCLEICDNGIDDDLDGLVDGEDPDCCRYYANLNNPNCWIRDCREDANFIETVKFVDNTIIPALTGAPQFDDAINIRLIFYEFSGSTGIANPNEKQVPGYLFGYCGAGGNSSSLTTYLQNNYLGTLPCSYARDFFFGIAVDFTAPANSRILATYESPWGTLYTYVDQPMDRVNKTQWLGEWDGEIYGGNFFRCRIIASNIKVINENYTNTVIINSNATTTIGSQSGAGGQTASGQSTGSGGGWNFNSSSSSGVVINSSVNYSLNTQAEEPLGTVDFEYCSGLNDNGGNVGVFPLTTCNPFNSGNPDYNCYISTPTNGNWNMMVTGAEELSSGSITLKTSIEHN